MEKAQLTAPSKFRLFINRIIATLKVTAASALLVYAFYSTYSLASLPGPRSSSSDVDGAMLLVAWLFLFGGMSWAARFFVKRPISIPDSRWIVSFLLVALGSSILFPLGSLFVQIYLSTVYFFGPPSAAMQKAASDMTVIGVPLTVYIHYVIIAYDEMDTRTLWQRIRHLIVFFMEKKIRLLYLAVAVFFLYQSYSPFHVGDGSSGITGLTAIAVSGSSERVINSVGREKNLRIDGLFPSGNATDITSPIFGTKYTSSDPSVATVSNKGVVVGVAPGNAVIHVENGVHTVDIPVVIYERTEGIALRADVDGSVLPGSKVTFYATVSNDNPDLARIRIHSGWSRATRSGDIFVFTREIPSDFTGEMHFDASGTIYDEEEYASARYTSNTVSILVKPDLSKLTGLKISRGERFTSSPRDAFFLRVIGIFSDGAEYNLSDPRFGTIISSSDPLIAKLMPTVSGTTPVYRVDCLKIGETDITATNSGFSATLTLEVVERKKQ